MSRILIPVLVFLVSNLALHGVASADTVVVNAIEDTSPYSFLPNLPRFNNPTMYAFQTFDETGIPHNFETYLWFDVAAAAIPPGQFISQALLAVTYGFDFTAFGMTSPDPGILDCRKVLEPWDHTTLTWANRPAADIPFDTITGINSFGALICDATLIVQGWMYNYAQPNDGFALTSDTARVMGMYSLEAAVAPALMPTLILTTTVPEPGFAFSLGAGVLVLTVMGRRSSKRNIWTDSA